MHWPIGVMPTGGMHCKSLFAVFVVEGVVDCMLPAFCNVMYQLADPMLKSHETGGHWLDTTLDVFDIRPMLEGYSAGAAFLLAVVDLVGLWVWEGYCQLCCDGIKVRLKGRAIRTLVSDGLVSIMLSCLLLVLKSTVAIAPHRTVPTDPLVFICEDIMVVLLRLCGF